MLPRKEALSLTNSPVFRGFPCEQRGSTSSFAGGLNVNAVFRQPSCKILCCAAYFTKE